MNKFYLIIFDFFVFGIVNYRIAQFNEDTSFLCQFIGYFSYIVCVYIFIHILEFLRKFCYFGDSDE